MAISMRLYTRRRTAVATATRLPRYARNDKVGTHESQFNQSLRGAPAHPELAEGRGNLDEVVNTSANRLCYFDEIAALRSQ